MFYRTTTTMKTEERILHSMSFFVSLSVCLCIIEEQTQSLDGSALLGGGGVGCCVCGCC